MAKLKYAEQRVQAETERRISRERNKLRVFSLISLAVVVLLLLFMFVDWAAIYNTDMEGNEAEISGFNCVAAGLSGDYTSTEASVGKFMAVPFNYYASTYLRTLSAFSVAVLFVVIAHLLIQIFAVITNKQGAFNILAILFAAAEFGLFIACYAVALSMNDSQILPKYCSGNPACSIQSQAILPALFALLSFASPILAMIREGQVKKMLAEAQARAAEPVKTNTRFKRKRR